VVKRGFVCFLNRLRFNLDTVCGLSLCEFGDWRLVFGYISSVFGLPRGVFRVLEHICGLAHFKVSVSGLVLACSWIRVWLSLICVGRWVDFSVFPAFVWCVDPCALFEVIS
jgi:hypothetical protein